MPKFLVFESYQIEHEVEADTAEEAIEKVSEDDAYQFISESTCVMNLEIYK